MADRTGRETAAATRPRILMLAPHPVLQPRGSPIHVCQRIQALSRLGYDVDLVTYPLGEPFEAEGLRIFRVPRPWPMRRIRIGPSPAKLVLDLFLGAAALRLLAGANYAAIHSNEEAAFLGLPLARRFRLPHLYDMHSSLPVQLAAHPSAPAAAMARAFAALERWIVRESDVVVAISPRLRDHVLALAPGKRHVLIENVAAIPPAAGEEQTRAVRLRHGLGSAPTVVYTGNLEPYQGIDLLLESFALLRRSATAARLLIVGGDAAAIRPYRDRAAILGVAEAVTFVGSVPLAEVGAYLAAGDVLASPRLVGNNTPMKLYTYLAAGKPLVATDTEAHTQVLPAGIAELAAPRAETFAAALLRLLSDRERSALLASEARAFAAAHFGDDAYTARVAEAYELLLGDGRGHARSAA